MIKYLPVVGLVFLLSGCEFLRSVNTEEVRTELEKAAIEYITQLNEEGFDPIELTPEQRSLAKTACVIVREVAVSRVEDEVEAAELSELISSVCRVLDKALEDAPEPSGETVDG